MAITPISEWKYGSKFKIDSVNPICSNHVTEMLKNSLNSDDQQLYTNTNKMDNQFLFQLLNTKKITTYAVGDTGAWGKDTASPLFI